MPITDLIQTTPQADVTPHRNVTIEVIDPPGNASAYNASAGETKRFKFKIIANDNTVPPGGTLSYRITRSAGGTPVTGTLNYNTSTGISDMLDVVTATGDNARTVVITHGGAASGTGGGGGYGPGTEGFVPGPGDFEPVAQQDAGPFRDFFTDNLPTTRLRGPIFGI